MDYREKNKGFVTASKLKLFIESPLLYKLVYVDNVSLDKIKKSPALEIGSIVDKYLLTPAEFKEEYTFPVAGLKADLIKYCDEHSIVLNGNEKVDDIKALIYGNKKVLTDAQTQIVKGIYEEVNRQPLWRWKPEDSNTNYWPQLELTAEYKYLKLKGTLDRFYLEGDIAIIRDLKTTNQMHYNTFANSTQFYSTLQGNDPFHYKLQMAMYVWLVKQNYPETKRIRVIIDAIGTTDPYFYQGIEMDVSELEVVWEKDVIPILEDLNNLEEGIVNWNQKGSLPINRNKLSGSQYYRLDADDCIQKEFDQLNNIEGNLVIPKPDEIPEDFDRDSL